MKYILGISVKIDSWKGATEADILSIYDADQLADYHSDTSTLYFEVRVPHFENASPELVVKQEKARLERFFKDNPSSVSYMRTEYPESESVFQDDDERFADLYELLQDQAAILGNLKPEED